MKLSDYVAKYLRQQANYIFVGNGGVVVNLLDSISNLYGITVIPCQNEQGASIAAEAYSRVTGEMGLALSTAGPGMLNLMQGIGCAYFDSIPVLFITGAPPINQLKNNKNIRQQGFQEMDVIDIVNPITKYAILLKDPYMIRYELEKLIYMANEGNPGPVLIDIPDDLQRVDIGDPKKLKEFVRKRISDPNILREPIYDMLSLIKSSEKPVVIVGGGVKISHMEQEMIKFLENTGLPFVTTWSTIDLFQEDTLNLIGNFGISSNRYGNFAIQNSDLIISFGSRLDTHQTGSDPSKFAPKAKKICINIDAEELKKDNGMKIDLSIYADLKEFLPILNTYRSRNLLIKWKSRIKVWKIKYPICLPEYYKQKDSVNPYVFMDELSKQTKDDDIIITDAGATLTWTMQAYKIRHKQKLFSAFNHSPMGYALPASIGAQFASFGSNVICITGDGGMSMNIQELETIVHNNLPIKIFVMNNGEYGIIKQTQDIWLNSRYVASDPNSGLGFPDINRIARAYGIITINIDNHDELKENIRYVLNYGDHILCNVNIKSGEQIIPKLEFGRSLENLSPLLPEKELKEIMED